MMSTVKLFVAYGYNDRDQWVKDLVIPMAEAFQIEVLTGEETYWGQIPQAVLRTIQASDALMAFTTKRKKMDDGSWTTHHWVLQEMGAAMAHGHPVVEVRELGIDPQPGMQQVQQRIDYDEGNRERCLREIVKALGKLRFGTMEVQILLPVQAMELIGPLAREAGQLHCTYTVREGNHKSEPFPTEVDAIKGGLFITIRNVSSEALIKVRLQAAGRTWNSDFDSARSSIQLS